MPDEEAEAKAAAEKGEKGEKVEDEKKDDDEVLLSPSPTAQRTHHPHVSPKCNHMSVCVRT